MPPDSRQPRRSQDRPDPSRPSGATPDGADEARLRPAEQARIDEAVVRVGRGGGRPLLVAALVLAAFVLGLVRPWDWLRADPSTTVRPGTVAGATAGPGVGGNPGVEGGPGAGGPLGTPAPGDTAPAAPFQAPTCGYPASWRTASISLWGGRLARVWTATDAVAASGPDDPSIPFGIIASDTVEAIGWCAPVSGPERPPVSAVGTLFRLRDGIVTPVPVDRLEPNAPDALGELWVPPAPAAGRRPNWTPGRYVVRLATPSGSYVRYLGLDVGTPEATAVPSPGSSPAVDTDPGSSPAVGAPVPRR